MTTIDSRVQPDKMDGRESQRPVMNIVSILMRPLKAALMGRRSQEPDNPSKGRKTHHDKFEKPYSPPPSEPVQRATHHYRSSSEQLCEPEDAEYWWLTTSPMLTTLMEHARYSEARFDEAIKAYDDFIVGSLGPRPSSVQCKQWKSFMTDDFTPIEMSWDWGSVRELVEPTIRFSIEPIGLQSGTASDPWNMQPTIALMRRLEQRLPSLDTFIFNKLKTQLTKTTEAAPLVQDSPQSASPSSMFVAFELQEEELMVKSYMHPFRCVSKSVKSCGETTVDFLQTFADEVEWHSLVTLLDFFRSDGRTLDVEPFMIAFDCVRLPETRMKVYVRSSQTSYRAVCKVLSLFQDTNTIGQALKDLEQLWKLIFDLGSGFDPDASLKHRDHETSGMLYYFQVRPGSSEVTSKVYLPIKHYAADDLTAAHGLVTFMRQMRGPRYEMADNFLSALRKGSAHRDLRDGRGLQTYLSCAIKKGELDITSYLNPEVNHPARRAA